MEEFVINLVSCVVLRTLTSILMPDGKIKSFASSMIGLILFYCLFLLQPLCKLGKRRTTPSHEQRVLSYSAGYKKHPEAGCFGVPDWIRTNDTQRRSQSKALK